jgi:hypothetical protein
LSFVRSFFRSFVAVVVVSFFLLPSFGWAVRTESRSGLLLLLLLLLCNRFVAQSFGAQIRTDPGLLAGSCVAITVISRQ